MRWLLCLSYLVVLSLQECSWNSCPQWVSSKETLKVHLIPHTHDDLGWIKTVDEYYYGAKQTLVPVGVQYIYNTVIDELMKDSSKKFSFAETGFLYRWWSSHSEADHRKLQQLIENGQIELIGGGWVQNDEAASHYVDVIDQMTLGLKKLSLFFGECGKPKVAWQIDPFGHSKELANLFAMMGFSSLFFARIHYLEKQNRLQNKSLEFIWNTSDDLKTQILTGAFYQDNYGPPEGFCWDSLCGDDPIMDNYEMEGYNVDEKLASFAKHVRDQADVQRSNHVMLLMGSDFQYTNANNWYTNMDKLIRYVNSNTSLNIQVAYSTPSCYVKGLTSSRPHLPTKNDDFFPYASSEHSFWTGYFTSRPTLKGMIRQASANLQLAKRLSVLGNLGASTDISLELMKRASALVQHHDAVTGTAKENVTKDYVKRLHNAFLQSEVVINDFMKKKEARTANSLEHIVCHLSNETICDPVKDLSTFAVSIFNSAGQQMKRVVKIPYFSKTAIVQNEKGEIVPSQISKTFQSPQQLFAPNRAPYELFVEANVAPLGFTSYIVDNSTTLRATGVNHPSRANEDVFIENEELLLGFDSDGFLNAMTMKKMNHSHPFRQEFFYYKGVDNTTSQPSGAYIFRPTTMEPIRLSTSIALEVVKGPLFEEVRQTITPWATQIIRLYKNSAAIEFDWTIGPIPKEDSLPITKEIVTRYFCDVKNGNEFFTDSSGRQMMKRVRDHSDSFTFENTEPTASNYYPITNRMFIKDSSRQLTVLTDRAQGGTANNGMIELMVHRRSFYDDHWGVEEALDEPGSNGKGLVVRGTHTVVCSSVDSASSVHRPLAVKLFHQPVVTVSNISDVAEYKRNFKMTYSGLTLSLPEFLNLLTLEKWNDGVLIRLEHLYQSEEDIVNSKPQGIDIKDIFSEFDIVSMTELRLGGNQELSTSRTSRYNNFYVQLKPMEIRTFYLQIKQK